MATTAQLSKNAVFIDGRCYSELALRAISGRRRIRDRDVDVDGGLRRDCTALRSRLMTWLQMLVTRLDTVILVSTSVALLVVLALGLHQSGTRTLGAKSQSMPSTLSWVAVIFAVGTGAALLSQAAAAPLQHAAAPPFGHSGPPETRGMAMNITLFHVGLHGWAVIAAAALAIGLNADRHDLPWRPSAAFYPLIGERVRGHLGTVIDSVSALITLLSLAIAMRSTAIPIVMTLGSRGPLPIAALVLAIGGIALAATGQRGLYASAYVTCLALAALLAMVLVAGPTARPLPHDLWEYLRWLPANSTEVGIGGRPFQAQWLHEWTVPQWAYWLAWAPCAGTLVARLSKGRSVREVVLGTAVAPAALCCLTSAIVGNAAFAEQRHGDGLLSFAADASQAPRVVFDVLGAISPFATAVGIAAMLLLTITSLAAAGIVAGERRRKACYLVFAATALATVPWSATILQWVLWLTAIALAPTLILTSVWLACSIRGCEPSPPGT